MPNIDLRQVLEEFKPEASPAQARVVVATANAKPDDVECVCAADLADSVTKPIDNHSALAVAERALNTPTVP